jgi:hypothetical protein
VAELPRPASPRSISISATTYVTRCRLVVGTGRRRQLHGPVWNRLASTYNLEPSRFHLQSRTVSLPLTIGAGPSKMVASCTDRNGCSHTPICADVIDVGIGPLAKVAAHYTAGAAGSSSSSRRSKCKRAQEDGQWTSGYCSQVDVKNNTKQCCIGPIWYLGPALGPSVAVVQWQGGCDSRWMPGCGVVSARPIDVIGIR